MLIEMSKKNPEKANQLKLMISSGKNPEQALMEFAQKREISMEQLNELKQGTPPIAMQTIYDWEHEKAIHELLGIKKKLDMFKSSM